MKLKPGIIYVIVALFCLSFTEMQDKDPQWEGHWTENWGVGQETDIDYHDKYIIKKDEVTGMMRIWSADKDQYRFCDVSADGNVLELKLVNTTGYDTMPYHLVMEKGNNKMTGYAYSVHGRKMNIEWFRDE
jgi:hypothetical protein